MFFETKHATLGRKDPERNVFKQFYRQNVAAVVCYELYTVVFDLHYRTASSVQMHLICVLLLLLL